jgi:hypothetical protein
MKQIRLLLTAFTFMTLHQNSQAQSGTWAKAGNSLTGIEKLGSTNAQPIRFFTNNIQRMSLDISGKLGIGTTSPKSPLHVVRAPLDGTPDVFTTLSLENNDHNHLTFLTPSTKEAGIIFQTNPLIGDGSILYNTISNPLGMEFKTNGFVNMALSNTGQLGIGIPVPKAKLHIQKGVSGVSAPIPNSPLVVETGSSNFVNLLTPLTSSSGVLFGNPANAGDGGIIFNGPATSRGLQFTTAGNVIRMALTAGGRVGIGTTAPLGKVHIRAGISGGQEPNSNSVLVAESAGDNFFSLLSPSTSRTGLLFGNSNNNADGGLLFNDPGTLRGLQFRTGSNQTRMVIASNGKVGIGTKTPGSSLHIVHNDAPYLFEGLRLENGSDGKYWTLGTFGVHGNLHMTANGIELGFFDGVSGNYISVSDARSKKDIEKAPDVLESVMKLEVKKYHFLKNKSDDKKHYGMIAQDVEKLFPEIVAHDTKSSDDSYLVNYSAYGVIAIKAIQEQQKTIESQQEKIERQETINSELQEKLNNLEEGLARLEASGSTPTNTLSHSNSFHKETGTTALQQNAPNPFSSSTTIRHQLPQGSSGQINIYDVNGRLVMSVTTGSPTHTIIDGGNLQAGTYTYSLLVNGKMIGTKKMIVLK